MVKSVLTETQKGKLAQDLLAQVCLIGSNGKISVALPMVDDEAIDLIFYLRGLSEKTLFAQVKSRWTSSEGVKGGKFRTQVRKASFHARDNYYLIFVAYDEDKLQLVQPLWFVPSTEFVRLTKGQKQAKRIVFESRFDSNDMWKPYRLNLRELASSIIEYLCGASVV